MEIKTFEDIVKAHDSFVQQIQQHLDQFSQKQTVTPETAIQQKEELLSKHDQQLQATVEAKEAIARRYDEEIRQHNEAIERLKQEIHITRNAIKRDVKNESSPS
jgi:tRNA nucleotidyltransferase/poly(A) polymerase